MPRVWYVGSASHLTCTFTIPSDAAAGAWDVVITNPDGQSVTYANYFIVTRIHFNGNNDFSFIWVDQYHKCHTYVGKWG